MIALLFLGIWAFFGILGTVAYLDWYDIRVIWLNNPISVILIGTTIGPFIGSWAAYKEYKWLHLQ